MKTSRRGFFATVVASLLGRHMPKSAGEVFFSLPANVPMKHVSLNGFQEALNDGVGWSGDDYPTYGSVARNGPVGARIQLKMELAKQEIFRALGDKDFEA